MTDPDLSIGSPEDRAHRDQIDADAMTAAKLREVLALIEAATGPDRAIDEAVALLHGFEKRGLSYAPDRIHWYNKDGNFEVPGRFTGSLDAVTALIERELRPRQPHMTMTIRYRWSGKFKSCFAEITWPSREFQSQSTQDALALLAAYLRARIAEAEQA